MTALEVALIVEAGGLAALLGHTREQASPDRRQAALLGLCYEIGATLETKVEGYRRLVGHFLVPQNVIISTDNFPIHAFGGSSRKWMAGVCGRSEAGKSG